MEWCEDEDALRGIFLLKQDAENNHERYSKLICKFIGEYTNWQLEEADIKVLSFMSDVLAQQDNPIEENRIFIKWIPEYSCALIARLEQGCHPTQVRYLSLIGLDKWRSQVEGMPDNKANYSSASDGYAIRNFHPVKDFEKYLECYEKAFNEQINADSQKRRNKTPAFIEAVIKNAFLHFEDESEGTFRLRNVAEPRTGWTDVMDHIGGHWPLVSAVCKYLLSFSTDSIYIDVHALYLVFLCHFELWLLERHLDKSTPLLRSIDSKCSDVVNVIDFLMQMLSSVARKTCLMEKKQDDIDNILKRCERVRERLDKLIAIRSASISHKYIIKLDNVDKFLKPCIALDSDSERESESESIDDCDQNDIEKLCGKNLRSYPLVITHESPTPKISEVLAWVKFIDNWKPRPFILMLTTIESFMIRTSKELNTEVNLDIDVLLLEELILVYRHRIDMFLDHLARKETGDMRSILRVEVISKEVLVVWIAYCIIHKCLKNKFSFLAEYSVALDWKNIRYLVLSSKEMISASLQVCEYLKVNSNGPPLFSLKDQDGTLKMAERFTKESPMLYQIWKNEDAAAKRRVKEHWEIVKQKQEMISTLHTEKTEKEQLRKELKSKLRRRKSYLEDQEEEDPENDEEISRTRIDILLVEQTIRFLEGDIRDTRIPPRSVFQPLPKSESLACRSLFFLHMPTEMEIFARFSIMARQILLPNSKKVKHTAVEKNKLEAIEESLKFPMPPNILFTDLTVYYNNHLPSATSATKSVEIHSHGGPPRRSTIERFDVMTYCEESDGVWYPDELFPIMVWKGGAFELDKADHFFNPFELVDSYYISQYFTERSIDRSLQWILTLYGQDTRSSRGNYPFAYQYKKPSWLRKNQWLELANLRAFPYHQLQNICTIISNRSVPFDNPFVHNVIRLALYHLGDISDTLELEWKSDQFFGDFGVVIQQELKYIADELSTKPRDNRSVLLLIEIAGYVTQWKPSCQQICLQFANILMSWIEDIVKQMAEADAKIVNDLRVKKALFCKYAILCYAKGDITKADARVLCRLILLAYKDDNLIDENGPHRDEIESLTFKSQNVICSRISDILREAKADGYAMLTVAVKEIIYDTPDYLAWQNLFYNRRDSDGKFRATCFRAWSREKDLYAIDLMSGNVLLNGKPISQLPVSILDHPLYVRTFNGRNFETVVMRNAFHTTMLVKGCQYTFELNNEDLIIHEIDPTSNCTLQLLPYDGPWCEELPVRLRKLHSHWYNSEEGMIFLRDINFCERNVDFVIKKEKDESWTCFRVPSHLRAHIGGKFSEYSLYDLYPLDQLVHNEMLQEVFEKFENIHYVHVYLSNNETAIVELPRYKLQFSWCIGSSKISSMDYAGYHMALCQQLDDTLLGFKKYLLLECDSEGYKHTKVIVPAGKIDKCDDGVKVMGKNHCAFEWSTYCYDIHPRFKNLEANSVVARLQLAELYAASGSLLPEKRMKMTGGEVAMMLTRQCWTNQPMQSCEYAKLDNLPKLCHRTPGLSLLSYEIVKSSLQTRFLYPQKCCPIAPYPEDKSNEYFQREHPWNPRSSLTIEEEFRLFGRCGFVDIETFLSTKNSQSSESIKKSGIAGIGNCEKDLEAYLLTKKKIHDLFQFCDVTGAEIKRTMITDLKDSLKVYSEMPEFEVAKGLLPAVQFEIEDIQEGRTCQEKYLLNNISQINGDTYSHIVFKILRTANISPMIRLEDLMKAACSIEHLKLFNPFLSTTDFETLKREIFKWLQLCVLEDKLHRLYALLQSQKKGEEIGVFQLVVKELRNVRTWPVEEHPEWLVFEVLSRVQIRPIQYLVAKSVITAIDGDNLCPITQLNMGEGKTRVILPMLILHWMKRDKLVRLNFLSPLIQEAFDYLHRHLGATLFECKIHLLPFNRKVSLTIHQTQAILESLKFCLNSNGILLVTPQQRQSLQLKWYEVEDRKKGKLLTRIDNLPYVDILDECDEVLRIKSKLIYACGTSMQLPSGHLRWCVLQTLLHTIKKSSKINDLLSEPGVAHWKQTAKSFSEAFRELRLVDGAEFEAIKQEFYKTLFEELIEKPPYELRWIKKHDLSKKIFTDYVTSPDIDENFPGGTPEITNLLLSLRGYLANGLLAHCLMKRNRVDYGIKRPSPKRMAVPFHAVETPAPRAEFGHPDCSIIFTSLAYYYDGMTRVQVIEAFDTLLSLGETAQKSIYKMWYQLSEPYIKYMNCTEKLDSVSKIDLSNGILVSLLVECFKFNIATINFWLENVVFPIETIQFQKRLEATSWDIASNNSHQVAGFSGTNDEKVLLPSNVSWIQSDECDLLATDGKMIQLITQNATFQQLDLSEQLPNNTSQWVQILDVVIKWSKKDEERTCALIDAGALLAGIPSNKVVAVYLAKWLDPSNFQGIVYFHENEWWVRDHHGREWPKHSSPIHERDAFVYFDESRCRGADMRLRMNSKAILTLGPKMCKDKLMQAAGRMRQLENGQKILMVALDDVTKTICAVNEIDDSIEITPGCVLKWVLANTVASVAKWLPEWGVQGGRHIIKQGNKSLAILPDMVELKQMYGHQLSAKPVNDVWKHWRRVILTRRKEGDLTSDARHTLNDIDKRIEKYGCDVHGVFSNFEEECERELEKEVEHEIEVERQILAQHPRMEKDWDVASIVSSRHLFKWCFPGLNLQLLSSFISTNIFYDGNTILSKGIKLDWPNSIYCTDNFFFTCRREEPAIANSSLNDYLRLVNSFLVYPSGDILLLSEREADKVLKYLWKEEASTNCCLVNLTYCLKKKKNEDIRFRIPKSSVSCPTLHDKVLAALQLFNGVVTYDGDARKKALTQILDNDSSKAVASIFPTIRGLSFTYQRSDLEEICEARKMT